MEESRNKIKNVINNEENCDDEQFLKDIQRATRLSIESYKIEQELRDVSKLVLTNDETTQIGLSYGLNNLNDISIERGKGLDIKARPRPTCSRPISLGTDTNLSSSSKSGNTGSIVSPPLPNELSLKSIPPPFPFKRHRSLPYRRHITHPPIGQLNTPQEQGINHINQSNCEDTTKDLILLASPLVTHKNIHNPNLIQATSFEEDEEEYSLPFDQLKLFWDKNTREIQNINSSDTNLIMSNNNIQFSQIRNSNISGISTSKDGCHQNNSSASSQVINFSLPQQTYHDGTNSVSISHVSSNFNNQNVPSTNYHSQKLYPTLEINQSGINPLSGIGTTSTVIGGIINDLHKNVKSLDIQQSNSPEIKKASPCFPSKVNNIPSTDSKSSNLYRKVSDDLQKLTETNDLIDFGSRHNLEEKLKEIGSKNILEYFDPLLIREAENNKNIKNGNKVNDRNTTKLEDKEVEEVYNNSITSCTSTATSAFTFRGSNNHSIYPRLDEFNIGDNLYGSLRRHGSTNAETSSLYDVYDPLEYVYSVACSSPTASNLYMEIDPQHGSDVPTSMTKPLGFVFETPIPYDVITPQPTGSIPSRNSVSNSSISSRSSSSKIQLRTRTIEYDKSKRGGVLYENIEQIKDIMSSNCEMQSFFDMVREVRVSCRHVDSTTNKGYIRSPLQENHVHNEGYSIKVLVWSEDLQKEPIVFTSEITSTVDVVLEQSILLLNTVSPAREYIFRVKGMIEYMEGDIPLAKFVYIQQCIKLDQDVQLIVVSRSSLSNESWGRTARDDARAINIDINDILPELRINARTFNEVNIPWGIIENEIKKITERTSIYTERGCWIDSKDNGFINSSPLIQPIKAVCVLLNEVVTIEIVKASDDFIKVTDEWNSKLRTVSPSNAENNSSVGDHQDARRAKIGRDSGSTHSFVDIVQNREVFEAEARRKRLLDSMATLKQAVTCLIDMYSHCFPASFRMNSARQFNDSAGEYKTTENLSKELLVRVVAVHRVKPEWLTSYVSFSISVALYHGSRYYREFRTFSKGVTPIDGNWFFKTIVFDHCEEIADAVICTLPREARLVFTLCGKKIKDMDDNNNGEEYEELGWASMQLFDFKGIFAQGHFLLPFWQVGLVQKYLGPAPNSAFSSDGNSPLLTIELDDFGGDLHFPEVPSAVAIPRDFSTLDTHTKNTLTEIMESNPYTKFPPRDLEVFWEKRHYTMGFPRALPRVLSIAQLWDYATVSDLYAILNKWKPSDPMDCLELLQPKFADSRVRETAINWISEMADEDLINLIPQLVEALSCETFDLSPLSRFLLKKSLSSLPFSHSFFWMIVSQIGLGKWADSRSASVEMPRNSFGGQAIYDPRTRRLELMLNSLMVISGEKWRHSLIQQYKMMENLKHIAVQVKLASKESSRNSVLSTELKRMSCSIFTGETLFPLPISVSTLVNSVHPNPSMSSYFNSNAVPLKVSFLSALPENGYVSTIYKVGDDLTKDMMTIQTIRVIEKWWLKSGLDLRVLTFSCVPTGPKRGMVEMVSGAETLCRIQAECGVTGMFREKAITSWLAKMNPSTLEYRRAIDNFTRSCAAYCVLTYVLGICDRHNDNIMITKKGHLFHIDFGKFLGDAQTFIKFKRDRTPFVLTSDMLCVINDGEQGGGPRFHQFVQYCCQAFRIVRENGDTLLNMFALMVTARIDGVDMDSVDYIAKALLPGLTKTEADVQVARFIEESSQNWFTGINFFIHSLGQMRFSSETNDCPTSLSFVPTIFRMEDDGRIEKAYVESFEKKYDPEKYYLYIVKVKRKCHTDWSTIRRTYKEFFELRSKLSINFPKADRALKPLPTGRGFGRANVKEVAGKRKQFIDAFLRSLFNLADEIAHSDLVYTFFHPLLRDEQQYDEADLENERALASHLRDSSRIHGEIRVGLHYERGALRILITHAVDLACPNGQPPSPYVKTYLRPDRYRDTKRKTRVLHKTNHPCFMDTLEYRLPLEIIRQRTLEVSVWSQEAIQENSFLGSVYIPLGDLPIDTMEITDKYRLENLKTFV